MLNTSRPTPTLHMVRLRHYLLSIQGMLTFCVGIAFTSNHFTPPHALFAAAPMPQLVWQHGDQLPGELLPSETTTSGELPIRWKSSLFDDAIQVSSLALSHIEFPSQYGEAREPFRITLQDGSVFSADLIASDEDQFRLSNRHFGVISVGRKTVKSIVPINAPNLVFDGSQFRQWQPRVKQPLSQLSYRVYTSNERWWKRWPDLSRLAPIKQGTLDDGRLDIRVADVDGQHAIRFEGQLEVPADGEYRFDVSVDDVAILSVDGQIVSSSTVGRDTWKRIQLAQGSHHFRIDFIEFGIAGRLSVKVTGPEVPEVQLAAQQTSRGWFRRPDGLAATRSTTTLHRPLLLPDRFDLDLEFASSEPPRMMLGFGASQDAAFASTSLQLEAWNREVALVHGNRRRVIANLEETATSLRLRVSYDRGLEQLRVIDQDGNEVAHVDNLSISPESGIAIRNRGTNLTIKHLRILKRVGPNNDLKPDTPGSEQSAAVTVVRLANGRELSGNLLIDAPAAGLIDNSGERTEFSMDEIDELRLPDVRPEDHSATPTTTLIFADGAVLRGTLRRITHDQMLLATRFSDQPLNCSRSALVRVEFPARPDIEGKETSRVSNKQSDQLLMAEGQFRGRIVFGEDGIIVGWQPIGGASAVSISAEHGAMIERNQAVANDRTYRLEEFPHRIHLHNGEQFPVHVVSCDGETVFFRSPYVSVNQLPMGRIKAVEFHPQACIAAISRANQRLVDATDRTTRVELPFEKEFPTYLERALIVPRFQRTRPPTHIVLTRSGDIKRGSWTRLKGRELEFDSKLIASEVSLDEIAVVVDVSSRPSDETTEAHAWKKGTGRLLLSLVDGSQLRLNEQRIESSADGSEQRLVGGSSVYDRVSISLVEIKTLRLADYDSESLVSPFRGWATRPAPEPELSIESSHSP